MTFWIIGCVLDGLLGAAILGCLMADYWRARKKKPGSEAIYKEGKMLTVPFGERALRFFEWAVSPLQKRQRTKSRLSKVRFAKGIQKMLLDTMGEEEGKREYRLYHAEQLGTSALTVFLMGMIVLFATLPGIGDQTLSGALERPSYGKGDRKENVSFTIQDAESSYTGSVTVTIPEKEITQEEAKKKVNILLDKLKTAYSGKVFHQDLSFPSALDGVLIQVKSLSSSVMRSDGRFLVMPGEKRQEVKISIMVSLSGVEENGTVTFYLASYEDLSLEERADWLKKELQQGIYVDEEALVLPEETKNGDTLTWTRNRGFSILFFLLLLIVIPILVFFKQENDLRKSMKGRTQRIQQAFPAFVGEVAILLGAGSSLRNAIKRLSLEYEKRREGSMRRDPLMEEVRKVSLEMEEGASMREALEHFSDRIHLRDVRRFVSLLNQNLRRGDENLLIRLNELTEEVWEKRKKEVREKTEEADTKLLIPLMMMLAVILIIVLAPCMMTIGV